MEIAQFWEASANGRVRCRLCPHDCRLLPGQVGRCHVRYNVDGELRTSTYGHPAFLGVEPIEKKYLFHAFPGSQTLSLGAYGCNMHCNYCINWRVSQQDGSSSIEPMEPEKIVKQALSAGVEAIAFTYTEPAIFFEYMLAIAQAARPAGLKIVAKSNGFLTSEVLEAVAPWVDAINIDLKGWDPASHRAITGASVDVVLENLIQAKRLGLWLEVSTLIVPGLNDNRVDLTAMAIFIATQLGEETPWHLLRFFPAYHMQNAPATSQSALQTAVKAGRDSGLTYVYAKDLAAANLHTVCPGCGTIVIERERFAVSRIQLANGYCKRCHQFIAGVGLS